MYPHTYIYSHTHVTPHMHVPTHTCTFTRTYTITHVPSHMRIFVVYLFHLSHTLLSVTNSSICHELSHLILLTSPSVTHTKSSQVCVTDTSVTNTSICHELSHFVTHTKSSQVCVADGLVSEIKWESSWHTRLDACECGCVWQQMCEGGHLCVGADVCVRVHVWESRSMCVRNYVCVRALVCESRRMCKGTCVRE